jgi:hypothetical protein
MHEIIIKEVLEETKSIQENTELRDDVIRDDEQYFEIEEIDVVPSTVLMKMRT